MKPFVNFFMIAFITVLASCHKLEDIFDHVKDQEDEEETASFTTSSIEAIHLFLADAEGNAPTDPEAPVFESRKGNPVLTPGGDPVTLEAFDAVKGKMKMTCTEQGTEIKLDLEGLIPFGTYSVWVLVFEEPGFDPTFAHQIGESVAGAHDGTEGYFIASSDGKVSYSVTVPEGDLSFLGSVTDCLLDEYEVHIVGAYHLDGHIYGGELGPEGKAVEQFGFMYRAE